MPDVRLYCGDCRDIAPGIESESVDAFIMDPPYPCIRRDYGYWTVEEWWQLIVEGVVPEVRRILKPTGSAVFILQPNSEHVGQMRGWLWEFMAWVCREWNMVQDFYWWDYAPIPTGGVSQGLAKSCIKLCVWCGIADCFRNQDKVLWDVSNYTIRQASKTAWRARTLSPSGHSMRRTIASERAIKRGGSCPYNIIPVTNGRSPNNPGLHGHGAGTPLKLADWWTRYICPPGGTVADFFLGSGTMGIAAVQNGCDFIGVDNVPEYVDIARRRIDEALAELKQPRQLRLKAARC